MKLIVLIPAHNEEKTISGVIQTIPQNIPGIDAQEIIVIDDGSCDLTAETAEKAGATVFKNDVNLGLGQTFSRGIHKALLAEADIVCTIDGDAQFNSNDIPHLIMPILHNTADFTTCTRFADQNLAPNLPFAKKWGNLFIAWFLGRITGRKITDSACGFRAYTKKTLLNLNLFSKFSYTQETLLDLIYKGFRLKEIPLKVKPRREYGKSAISSNLFRYGWQVFKILFRAMRDYKPLKFIGGLGIFLFLIGLAADFFAAWHFWETGQFTPYKYIGLGGVFLNGLGVLIFVIGLLADMINRTRLTQEKILYYEKKRFYSKF